MSFQCVWIELMVRHDAETELFSWHGYPVCHQPFHLQSQSLITPSALLPSPANFIRNFLWVMTSQQCCQTRGEAEGEHTVCTWSAFIPLNVSVWLKKFLEKDWIHIQTNPSELDLTDSMSPLPESSQDDVNLNHFRSKLRCSWHPCYHVFPPFLLFSSPIPENPKNVPAILRGD